VEGSIIMRGCVCVQGRVSLSRWSCGRKSVAERVRVAGQTGQDIAASAMGGRGGS
jgi:hypothetical protein